MFDKNTYIALKKGKTVCIMADKSIISVLWTEDEFKALLNGITEQQYKDNIAAGYSEHVKHLTRRKRTATSEDKKMIDGHIVRFKRMADSVQIYRFGLPELCKVIRSIVPPNGVYPADCKGYDVAINEVNRLVIRDLCTGGYLYENTLSAEQCREIIKQIIGI